MGADGIWNITMIIPLGSQVGTLELKTDGDTLSGTMSSPAGPMAIQDGKVDGNNLSWTSDMVVPMETKLEVTATIDKDDISGDIKLGTFGSSSFVGSRA